MSGKEQEAVCVRYVDHDLIVHEEFVGMYEVSVTTGENLAKVITGHCEYAIHRTF